MNEILRRPFSEEQPVTMPIHTVAAKAPSKPRRHPRARPPKDFLVAWRGGGRRDANRVRNLSLGGIFVVNIDPPAPGTPIELQFDSPEGEIHVDARVRFIKPRGGMGLEFVGMDFPARRRLYAMLKKLMS